MGSIVLQVNGSTVENVAEGAGVEIVRAVSEEDSARIIAALGDYYDSHFKARRGPNSSPPLEKNIENIIKVWWDDVIRQALKHVERYEAKNILPTPILVVDSVEALLNVETANVANTDETVL
jgi:hypothetical protein